MVVYILITYQYVMLIVTTFLDLSKRLDKMERLTDQTTDLQASTHGHNLLDQTKEYGYQDITERLPKRNTTVTSGALPLSQMYS